MTLSDEQKKRAQRSLKTAGIVVAVGLAYYLFIRLTGLAIPCIFYLISGAYCPGCGVTRMCMALMQLDFSGAFRANALIMVLLPAGVFFGVRRWLIYVKTGQRDLDRPEMIFVVVAFVMAVVFWILRNRPDFAFFAPGAA